MAGIIDYLTTIGFFKVILPFLLVFIIIGVILYFICMKLFDKTKLEKVWKIILSVVISIILAFIVSRFIIGLFQ